MGVRRLELLGVEEELRDPSDRRALFATLTDEQFKHMAGYVNSITRGEQVGYDYVDGKFTEGATPPPEDKEPLMNLAFKTVREITANPDLDDKTALRRAGLALAGAINYVHPYQANGRTSRVMQYFIEFGTERGPKAVSEELYALIGKLRVYESDDRLAIDNTPHPALDRALEAVVRKQNPDSAGLSPREAASARVVTFLNMMAGTTVVPINERVVMNKVRHGRRFDIEYTNPGETNGIEFVERQYIRLSEIPNKLPDEVPPESHRVMAKKPEVVAVSAGSLTLQDFLHDVID
jgi:hypothetical protein